MIRHSHILQECVVRGRNHSTIAATAFRILRKVNAAEAFFEAIPTLFEVSANSTLVPCSGIPRAMHFLYPSDPFRTKRPDEVYADEFAAIKSSGSGVSVFSLEEFQAGTFSPFPALPASIIIYRGWMLSADEYQALVAESIQCGAQPLTDPTKYLLTHHLPNWYPLITDLTPETKIFPPTADLAKELRSLGWPSFFIKDYVKSLKTSVGSKITSPEQADLVAAEMLKFRGKIEGGFCVRRVEDFLPHTEQRYFILNGQTHSATGVVPDVAEECAKRIHSPFFSVDVVEREDGVVRIVEVGDGQVSDLVGWTPDQFVSIFGSSVG